MKNRLANLYILLLLILLIPVSSIPSEEKNSFRQLLRKYSSHEAADLPLKSGTAANHGASEAKIAYITIDDGPSRNNTTSILDTLKEYEVKATFFVLPHSNLDDIYQRIISEGHTIGNHSFSHSQKIYTSLDSFKNDLLKAKSFMYKKFNYVTTVYRFPGGSMGKKKAIINKRAEILRSLGYQYYNWDVSVADTDPNLSKRGDENEIINLLVNNVVNKTKSKKRLIVLMHDDSTKTYTAKALPLIIKGLKEQGYAFDVLTHYH